MVKIPNNKKELIQLITNKISRELKVKNMNIETHNLIQDYILQNNMNEEHI